MKKKKRKKPSKGPPKPKPRVYEPPLSIDMDFEDIVKLAVKDPKKEPKK